MFLSSQLSITASRTMTSVSGRMAMTSPSLSTTTPRTVMFDMATFWGRTIFPVNTSMLRVVSYRIFVSWAKRALSPRRSRHFYSCNLLQIRLKKWRRKNLISIENRINRFGYDVINITWLLFNSKWRLLEVPLWNK